MHPFLRQGLILSLSMLMAACASTTGGGAIGVHRKQFLLVSSAEVDAAALQAYQGELGEATKAGKLNTDKATLERVRGIADRLIPQTAVFRPDALQWQWEVNLETNPELNAYCAPGGKIMFFSGIISKLSLTDDEIAAIMGHEMAHALREHGRERMSQAMAQQFGVQLGSELLGIQDQVQLAQMGAQLLYGLPNSREQESEADVIGLELMARAGYNPNAAVSLWHKMEQAGAGNGPAWLSTHPSGPQRINELQSRIPAVLPLYQQARANLPAVVPKVVPRH
ncbi:MAG TPA: M48 family metallopeptidase [Moraxellaceae bacterium]|nr:M48 family metallopeptidase [Moraxellaceae bacterium]